MSITLSVVSKFKKELLKIQQVELRIEEMLQVHKRFPYITVETFSKGFRLLKTK